MKRAVPFLLVAVLACACLTGCGRQAGENFGRVVAERQALREGQNNPTGSSASVVSIPIEPYQDGNFGPSLGFNVTGYPNNSTLSATKFFALDGWFSQIEFVSNEGQHLVLRTAFSDAGFLTTTYKELHGETDTTRTLNTTEVRTRNMKDGCSMVTWSQGEFQFLLHSNAAQGPLPTSLVDMVVSGTRADTV